MLAYLTQSPYYLYVALIVLVACYLVNSGAYDLGRRLYLYGYEGLAYKVRWVRWVITFKVGPLIFSQGDTLVPALAALWLLLTGGAGIGQLELFRHPSGVSLSSRCSPNLI